MAKEAHTPGPWYYPGRTISTPKAKTGSVGTVHQNIGVATPIAHVAHAEGCAEANARLIAAAPELLNALEGYMSAFGQALDAHFIQFGPQQDEAHIAARAAIAKARGESK